jgi:hypothetical protein
MSSEVEMNTALSVFPRTLCVVTVAAFGAAAYAQDPAPVPTRVRFTTYGEASGTPLPGPELRIRLEAASGATAIRVTGGWPGELAGVLIGRQPASIPLPFEATLLVDPVVPVFGAFDSEGSFTVPVDFADPTLVGDIYFQGLHYLVPGPGKPAVMVFQLTEGLHVTVVPGNAQPALGYSGPPLTATLVVDASAPEPRFELFNRIVAPSTDWDLRLEGVQSELGVTRVYLTLEAPNPNLGVLPVLETKRLPVDLGPAVAERIEIHIQQPTRGVPSPQVFQLAAVIETRF